MTVKSAVVGAGTVSDVHLAGLDRCPLTTLVAVCDVDEDRCLRASHRYGIRAYSDLEGMMAEEPLDWVHLCTPVDTHLPLARTAVEAGVAVQIEKPITETITETEELRALSDRHEVPVTEVQQHLFDPAMRAARARIESGELGRIRGVDTVYPGMTTPDEPNRGSWAFDLAGGEFEEGLPHALYLTLGAGGYPRSGRDICATTSLIGEYDREFGFDGAQVEYVTAEDRLCSATLRSGCAPQKLVHVHGEKGSLTADLVSQTVVDVGMDYDGSTAAKLRNNLLRARDRLVGTARNGRRVLRQRFGDWGAGKDVNPHFYQIDAEARALATDGPMPVSLEQSYWTVTLMETIRRSATETQEVPAQ